MLSNKKKSPLARAHELPLRAKFPQGRKGKFPEKASRSSSEAPPISPQKRQSIPTRYHHARRRKAPNGEQKQRREERRQLAPSLAPPPLPPFLSALLGVGGRPVRRRDDRHGGDQPAVPVGPRGVPPRGAHHPRAPLRRRPAPALRARVLRRQRHRRRPQRRAPRARLLPGHRLRLGRQARGSLRRRQFQEPGPHLRHRRRRRGPHRPALRAPCPPPRHPVPRRRARRGQPLVHPGLHPAPVLHRPRPLPPFPGILQPVPGEILPPAAPLPPRQHLLAAHAQPLPLLLADAEQRRRPGRQRHVQAAAPVAGDGRPQHAAPLHQRVRRHARRRLRRLEEPQRDRQRAGAGHRDRLALLRGPQGGAVRQQGQRQHLQLQPDQARRHGQARHADAARHAGQRVHLRALQRGPPARARVRGELGALPRQRHAGVLAPRQRVRRFLGERHHGPDLLHRVGRRGREGGAGGHGLGVRPGAVRLHGDTARGRLLPAQRRAEPRVVRIQHLLPVAGQGRRLLLLPGRRHGHHHGSKS